MLDGCCGAGGAARGYATAGFEVHGIDADPRLERDYLKSGAVSFAWADILETLADRHFVRSFSFVHVSPPCQHYSQMSRCRPGIAAQYPDLIGPVRELLLAAGVPYVIENVGAARPWLRYPVTLCGQMFGRPVYRHRLFEFSDNLRFCPPKPSRNSPDSHPEPAAVHDQTADGCKPAAEPRETARGPLNKECGWPHPVPAARAGHWKPGMYVSVSGHERKEPVREAMQIDWMRDRDDVAEAVPPYMTETIGRQVLAQL